eukprot:6209344-Pleurochrysis_carterae.AAC.5
MAMPRAAAPRCGMRSCSATANGAFSRQPRTKRKKEEVRGVQRLRIASKAVSRIVAILAAQTH